MCNGHAHSAFAAPPRHLTQPPRYCRRQRRPLVSVPASLGPNAKQLCEQRVKQGLIVTTDLPNERHLSVFVHTYIYIYKCPSLLRAPIISADFIHGSGMSRRVFTVIPPPVALTHSLLRM
uniref:Uncharacterized protein n=1 Tax=Xenopus tropicalis TaxID=8364 RepID=A0A1B8XT11_XENTR